MAQVVLSFFLGFVLFTGVARGAEPALKAVETALPPSRHVVQLGDQEIVEISKGFKAFSAEARARTISRRIAEIAAEMPLPALSVEESDISSDIMAGEQVLMSVFDADAEAAGKPRATLAADHARAFSEALARYQSLVTRLLVGPNLPGTTGCLPEDQVMGDGLFPMEKILERIGHTRDEITISCMV